MLKRKPHDSKYKRILGDNYSKKIVSLFTGAKTRCSVPSPRNTKYYIDRGIEFKLTMEELLKIWIRDNASTMHNPSLDRVDSYKNYTFNNCRIVEWSYNRTNYRGYGKIPDRTIKVSIKTYLRLQELKKLKVISIKQLVDIAIKKLK